MAPASISRKAVASATHSSMSATILIVIVGIVLTTALLYILEVAPVRAAADRAREMFAPSPADVVLVYSNGCGHCHRFIPIFDELSRRLSSQASFRKVEQGSEEFRRYDGVRGFPTIIVMQGADEKARHVGAMPYDEFALFVKKHV